MTPGTRHTDRGRLADVITLQRGFDLPESQRKDGDVPILASTGIVGFHAEKRVNGPGVVMGRSGSIGGGQYIADDFWPLNTTLWVKDFKGHHPRFVYYLLRNIDFTPFNAGAGVPTLNRNHLDSLMVPIFGNDQEHRIADILAAYDDLIVNNRRRMALLEDAARQLYREWFVRLRFPGHEHARITDGVPEGWERPPLGRCSKFLSGGTPSKARAEFWEGQIPWVSSGELTAMRIHRTTHNVTSEAVSTGSRLVPSGTILAVVRGMSLAKEFRIGLTAQTVAFNQDLKAIINEPNVDALFLFHSIDAQRDEIRDKTTDASHGTKKLDTPVLAAVPILMPPRPMQRLFWEYVNPQHSQWDTLDQQNQLLRTARDLLLPRMMSGEIAA